MVVGAAVLAALPPPVRCGIAADTAADLHGPLFAYGAGFLTYVVDLERLSPAAALAGGHTALVTAVKWCPDTLAHEPSARCQLRLASGDAEGAVVVWDVLAAAPMARLADVPRAAALVHAHTATRGALSNNNSTAQDAGASSAAALQGSSGQRTGGVTAAAPPPQAGVTSLAWVLPGRHVLAVVVAPALLLLWDTRGGGLLWHTDLGGGERYGQLAASPLDARALCLCGSGGALVALQIDDIARGAVHVQRFRVAGQSVQQQQQQQGLDTGSSSATGTAAAKQQQQLLQARWTAASGLLVVLLRRELLLMDLQLGAPCGPGAVLPASAPAFSGLLCVQGSGVCEGCGDAGGLDIAAAAHVDGSVSLWLRLPGQPRFQMAGIERLPGIQTRGAGGHVRAAAALAAE